MPFLTRFVPIGLVLLAWELVARLNFVNPNVFPPVTEIVLRFFALYTDGRIYAPLWGTLWPIAIAFLIFGRPPVYANVGNGQPLSR